VHFQDNSQAEELVSEINRLDKAIPFIRVDHCLRGKE
jgi:hypothetical protein